MHKCFEDGGHFGRYMVVPTAGRMLSGTTVPFKCPLLTDVHEVWLHICTCV